MSLAFDPVIFSVQGVLFRVSRKLAHIASFLPHNNNARQIPKYVLQLNSEAFSNMLELGSSKEDPIVLDDSLGAFNDWVALLLTYVGFRRSTLRSTPPNRRYAYKAWILMLEPVTPICI